MDSKICNSEIGSVLEKQGGAECVVDNIAVKTSVGNKIRNTEDCPVSYTEKQAEVGYEFLRVG